MQTVTKTQRILEVEVDDYLATWIEGFLLDRRAGGLAKRSVHFYEEKLKRFSEYCESQLITRITQITANNLREFLLMLGEQGHTPGGVHTFFRSIRAFMKWWEDEVELEGWKNPIEKVKAPKVGIEPLEPVEIEKIAKMLESCQKEHFVGERDRALLLALLDTGARANEMVSMDRADLNIVTGAILIRKGKGSKPRMVYLGKKARKAIRAYLRWRGDKEQALWITRSGSRISYDGLRSVMDRISENAGLGMKGPSLHSFRRAFALNFLRNNPGDIYSLQRLMGHADLSVLRRYLAQTDADIQEAHMRGSPVDNSNL